MRRNKMSATDRLNFSQEKIFKTAFEETLKFETKTKNVIDCKDNSIFLWHNKKKCLLTQNVKGLTTRDDTVYQELHPTEPPLIDINFIRLNNSVTIAALWSSAGVMVMEIPKRWGSNSGFRGGKPLILTRCTTIDMRSSFMHNVEVRQVRFHPGSPQDNHVVVLTSDNVLSVYKVPLPAGDEEKLADVELVQLWTLGQNPADGKGWNLRGNKVPFLASLGDLAVDFDFGLSIVDDEQMSGDESAMGLEKVVWPVVVLRGNGDVCYLNTSVISNRKPKFEGPLSMYPPADDNYGVEACSILVLATVPSIIVVATSSGTLYHSVLLKNDQNEKKLISNTTNALYVMECVESELGIQLRDDDSTYTCPVILHKDPVSRWKYYSTHNTGIHAISVSFVSHIEKFFNSPSPESFSFNHTSAVEYLVCTRTNATPEVPVLGFTIITATNVILAVLANGEVISLPLKITENLANPDFLSEEVVVEESTPIKKLLQEPFDVHIRSILKRNVNQPLIKLDKNVNLSPQESLDLISRATNLLRQEYFAKFQLVRDETEQRVMALRALLALHLDELNQLDNEKSHLQAMAEKLAEKYYEITEKQQALNQRIENVVSTVLKLEPIESLAEKKMKNELILVDEKVEDFQKAILRLKKEMNYQKFKKDKHRNMHLSSNQMEAIKTNLNKASQEIGDLVKLVNSIKKHLNMSNA